jgi:hypothetical protein
MVSNFELSIPWHRHFVVIKREFEFPKHKKIIALCFRIMMKVVNCGQKYCSQMTLNNKLIMKRQGIVVD